MGLARSQEAGTTKDTKNTKKEKGERELRMEKGKLVGGCLSRKTFAGCWRANFQ